MSRYTISSLAEADIKSIYRYVAADNVAARRLRATLVEKFRLLAAQPLLGEAREDLAENLRERLRQVQFTTKITKDTKGLKRKDARERLREQTRCPASRSSCPSWCHETL